MVDSYLKKHDVYKYATGVLDGSVIANWEIKTVCKQFIDKLNDADSPYFFDVELLKKLDALFKYINFGTGSKQGKPIAEGIAPFQVFFIANVMCWKFKKDPEKRQFEQCVMLIGRKQGKTFLTGILFILLLLTEPRFSTMFSVSSDLQLASILKEQMETIIKMSPAISKYFSFTRKEVRCNLTESTFTPLASSKDRLDGRICQLFLVDEVGSLPSMYPVNAMKSSQVGDMKNKTGIMISTAYPSLDNPMQMLVEQCEQILEGKVKDDSMFCLLYKPDHPRKWMDDDNQLLMANPLAQVSKGVRDAVMKQRQEAIMLPVNRSNFLTKHMNIFTTEGETEAFLTDAEVDDAEMHEPFDWTGSEVKLGFDLSQSGDNTAVAMSTYNEDTGQFVAKVWAFYPAERQAEKQRIEHIDYPLMDKRGYSFATGRKTVDYSFIEKFIEEIPEKYGVNVTGIGFDRWNAGSVVNTLEAKGFDMYEIKQNASGLYPGTKLLREKVQNGDFKFEENKLLKINFSNAMMAFDMNLSYYLNKKQSNGKIDMVAALVNTMALWNDEIEDEAAGISGQIYIL